MAQQARFEDDFMPEPIVRNRGLYPGMPLGWSGISFDSLTLDQHNRDAIDVVAGWASVPGGSLVLMGETGRGKTQITAALANELDDQGADLSAWTWGDWSDTLRNVFRQEADDEAVPAFKARMTRCGVLIIDDVTAEQTSRGVVSMFETIIDARWSARLATVITTNASKPQWETWSARALSRLDDKQRGSWLTLKGPDRRREAVLNG